MLKKLINAIEHKFANTVFMDAVSGLKYLYSRNTKILTVEMFLCYLASIMFTGWLMLTIDNVGGHAYLITIPNIFSMWLKRGIGWSLFVFVLMQIVIFRLIRMFRTKYRKDAEGNYDISTEGTYGTAGKMTEEEMKKTFILEPLSQIKATIFGKNPFNPKQMVGQKGKDFRKVNRNVFMVAGPSAGKSATFVINLIFQIMRRGESAIISDPKSELFKICSELGKKLGYEVRILNLNSMFLGNSDPCNYMMYVGDDVDKAQVVANAIIANTTGGAAMLDFWNEGALNLLQAVILRINIGNDFLPEQKNLPFLFTYITQYSLEELEEDFAGLSEDHPAYAPWAIFKDGDDKPKKQVLQGLRIKLKLFNSKKLRRILSESKGGIDILNPGRKKCLYFVGSNDQTSTMSSIISLFYTLLYQELVRYADERSNGELPVTVHMVLDEYANMGTIPDFEKKLSTVRSRNIVTYIVCQDINQLKVKHPMDTWKTVLNDCDYYMMLKTNDPDTMTWWSDMSGEMTTNVQNVAYEKSKMDILGLHTQERVSEGQGKRNVYTKDEVRKLGDNDVLVLVTQRNVAKLKTLFWKEHPFGKYLEQQKAQGNDMYILPAQHYPLWRLIDDGVVDEDYDYDNGPTYVLEMKADEHIDIDENYDADKLLDIKKNPIAKVNPKAWVEKKQKQATESIRKVAREKKQAVTESMNPEQKEEKPQRIMVAPKEEKLEEVQPKVVKETKPEASKSEFVKTEVKKTVVPAPPKDEPLPFENKKPEEPEIKKEDVLFDFEPIPEEPVKQEVLEPVKEEPKPAQEAPARDDFEELEGFFDDEAIDMNSFV